MKVVINACHGGFGLSTAAYEKLIEWGVSVRKYEEQKRGDDGLYKPTEANEGEVIFDRELTPPGDSLNGSRFGDRYWDTWTRGARSHPLIVRAVEELGNAASGAFADLHVVEIPDGTDYEISEYDGIEHVAEKHRTWR